MIRHLISGLLLSGVLGFCACAQVVPWRQAPVPAATQHFQPPTGTVRLTTLPSDAGLVPGVNAPATVTKVVRVALLLPLTGRHADIGRAMQDAATLGLYDKYAGLSLRESMVRVELLPKDTGDTAEQALAAAEQAVADGAEMIIGPIFAETTELVAPVARAKHIPIISLSNNVTHPGEGVFAFGFSPQDQTRRIVQYAVNRGKTRIAVLVPNTALGTVVLDSARETLVAQGLTLAAHGSYIGEGLGIDTAIQQLVPKNAPEFDALLIPEGGAPLGTILRTLAARGVTPHHVQFLGTGMWDDTTLLRKVPLDGAWLATLAPTNTNAFETRFRAVYQYVPPRTCGLAYDAVSLAVTLATAGHGFEMAVLTNDVGYSGPANGVFRLRSTGKTERALAVLQVVGDGFYELDPAPTGFVRKK